MSDFLRRMATAAVFIVLALAVLPAAGASAHANLVKSDPPAGAALTQPPDAITLTYSEDLDPSYTGVQLLDSSGGVVAAGPGVIPPGTRRVLQLALRPLPPGVYSAVWQARSATDGHETQGIVGFTVGLAEGSSAAQLLLLPPPGAPDPATELPDATSTLLRWATYLAAALLIGSVAFGLFVWAPVVWAAANRLAEIDVRVADSLKGLAAAGLAGTALFSLAGVAVQVGQAAHQPLWPAVLGTGEYLGGTAGLVLGVRFLAIGALAFLLPSLPPLETGETGRWLLVLALGSVIPLTSSLQSHSAARAGVLGIILDWEHLLAMSVWLGGLAPLFLTLRLARRSNPPPAVALVPRFSRVAIICVVTLAVTGLLNALPLVQTLDALTLTSAGRALLVKVSLFGVLVGLGAINLLILSPRLRREDGSAGRRLGMTVRIEMAIGLCVVLAASVMMGVAPAHDALLASRQLGPVERARIGQVGLTLRVAPGAVGSSAFGVDIADLRGGAAATPGQVVLRLSTVDNPSAGTSEVATDTQDGRRFTAVGSYLTLAGRWQIQVILRRSGFDDISQVFDLPIGPAPAGAGIVRSAGPWQASGSLP